MGEIDFVLPWVDGSDPAWKRRKELVGADAYADDRPERYRDWGLLPYWFRGVERFAPWVRKIWFVCDQEPPEWLELSHPKLRIVRHEDYLPEEYRPAFNTHAIELNLHRIEGLSERFVYFNDDTLLLDRVSEAFFFKNGLPRDCALLNTIPTDDLVGDPDARIFYPFLNNASYINRSYDFRTCFRAHPAKWLHPCYGRDLFRNLVLCVWPRLVGTAEQHLPQAFLKETFREAWEMDGDILDRTSRRHIRDDRDVNQWFIRLHHIMEGKFEVRRPLRDAVFTLGRDDRAIVETVRNRKKPMICVNDSAMDESTYRASKRELLSAFQEILPGPSAFER